MPRFTRGSSQTFMRSPLAARMHLVGGRPDRSGTPQTPYQHGLLAGGVVEAVPAAARQIDHVALARGLVARVGQDHAVSLEHDEEPVAIEMPVIVVARAGLEHGAAA